MCWVQVCAELSPEAQALANAHAASSLPTRQSPTCRGEWIQMLIGHMATAKSEATQLRKPDKAELLSAARALVASLEPVRKQRKVETGAGKAAAVEGGTGKKRGRPLGSKTNPQRLSKKKQAR